MKQIECGYTECGSRRAHWQNQDTHRGVQLIEVPDDYPEDKKAYCSITCAVMSGSACLHSSPPCSRCAERRESL